METFSNAMLLCLNERFNSSKSCLSFASFCNSVAIPKEILIVTFIHNYVFIVKVTPHWGRIVHLKIISCFS